jgi:predicted ATPase/DNA-binding CsgD family transcriptional regulator
MLESLTEREQEILLLLSQGMTNREIAVQLYLSQGTVKAHNHNIFSKLGVSTRTQALLRAQELGLLEAGDLPDTSVPANDDLATSTLPIQLTPFFGRKAELGKLTELLLDTRVRLITITGPGGTGKTRLAIEAARQQIDHFPEGVFFVPLAHTLEAHNIAATILDVLGLTLQADNTAQQLFAYLRGKRMLLVLDNYEHLLDAADFVTELLQAASEVKVLVTSRERLQLSAEVLYVLGGLDYDTKDADEPLAYSAVQLLVQRAQFVNPAFDLQPSDWEGVRRICQLTEGMPLALILAAGWLDMLTLEEIAAELAQSIDILASQLRDLPTRQRSMRMTIAASWNRLTRDEQRIFASLTVFRGGFAREAALRVKGAGLRELQTLVNRSFITVSEQRYEIHELLRQFGNNELQQSSYAVDVYSAHSAYYLDFLRQREADIKGRRQRAALDEIQADFENVHAAWEWALVRRNFEGIGQALECLTNFAEMRVYLVRIEDMFRQAVAALAPAGTETPHPVWDRVALRHVQAKHRLSLSGDRVLLETLLERARARSVAHEIAYTLWVMGNQALRERDYAAHAACLGESLAIWRRLGDEFYIAHALIGITDENMSPEASERSLRFLRESVAIRRRLGDLHNLSFSLIMCGIFLAYQGDFAASGAALEECLALQDDFNRTPDFAGIVSLKGMLAFWRGDLDAAAQLAELGLDFSQDMNYYGDKSYCLALLGLVVSLRGDYRLGAELCEQASQDELFNTMAVAVYWGLALARCGLHNDEGAWQTLSTALNIAWENLKSTVFQICCLPVAAVLLARAGEPARAAELLALAFSQPPDMMGWMHQWTLLAALRSQLETQLGADDFAAAWQRGEALELDTAVIQLLQDAKP